MTELQVKLNDGTTFIVEEETYNVEEMKERTNEEQSNMIILGSALVQRHGILRVIPLSDVIIDE